jgi:phosphoglycerol transferase
MAKKKRNKSGNPAAGSVETLPGVKPAAPVAQSTNSVAGNGKASTGFYNTAWFEWLSIAAVSALAFWFLTARLVGVQVSVLADEYLYVLDAHYKGLDEATYPNYLFQWIYSSTKMCGAEFYSCARSINALFVIFGAIFIYLLAKLIGRSKLLAGLAAVAAILGTYGTYTAYFMPEAIFNGLMMVFFWAIIRFGKTDNLLVWAAIGSSLGIASLAKPHGLFVVPAVVIFFALWTRATKDKWLIPALLRNVVFVASVVGTKFLFGYLLAGERGLGLFGMYGTLATVTEATTSTISSSVAGEGVSVFFTGWGQTLMVAIVIGLALPVSIHGFIQSFKRSSPLFETVMFRSLFGIALLNMMAAIALFEALLNSDIWMHTRYYSYLIPLALVALIEALRRNESNVWPWAKYAVVSVFLGLGVYNLVTTAAPYSSNWIDAPDFRAYVDSLPTAGLTTALVMIAALIWFWKFRVSMVMGLVILVSMSTYSGAFTSNFLRTAFGYEMGYEDVARIVRDFLPQDEADRAVFVGQNEILQRTVFSSLTGTAQIVPLSDQGLDRESLDPTKSWLIAVGEPLLNGFDAPTISSLGFNLFSLDSKNSLKPRNSRVSEFTFSCEDLESSDWACGRQTSVRLDRQFPASATVNLIFEVSQLASQGDIEFVLGDAKIAGKFPPGLNSINIKFANSKAEEELQINSLLEGSEGSESERFVRPVWGFAKSTN